MATRFFVARDLAEAGATNNHNGEYAVPVAWFVCRFCLRDYAYYGVTSKGEYVSVDSERTLSIGWRIGPGWERQHGDLEICTMCLEQVLFKFGYKIPTKGAHYA